MFIVLAKLLWAFDMLPPLDEAGREVKVDTSDEAFDSEGSTTTAKKYRVRWRVRSEEVKDVVENEAAKARREGYTCGGVKVG
jgi:hypothetical protein